MRIVSLIPLTSRAKQIIKQHGSRWEVVEKRERVAFSDKVGAWLLVLPLSEERAPAMTVAQAKMDSASRWVR